MKPLQVIRYILLGGSLLVMFFNLFDCIIQNVPVFDYLLYVGVFLVCSLFLIFLGGVNTVVWILFLVASIVLILDSIENQLSYALILFCFATYLKRDLHFRVLIYFVTLISCVFANVIVNKSPSDLINVLIGYIIMYGVSELVYLEIKNRHRREK